MKTYVLMVLVVLAVSASASRAEVLIMEDWENAATYGNWAYTPAGPITSGGANYGVTGLGNGPSAPGSKVFYDNATFGSFNSGFSLLYRTGYVMGTWKTNTTFTVKFDYKGGSFADEWIAVYLMYYNGSSNGTNLSSFQVPAYSNWQTYTNTFTYTGTSDIIGVYVQLLVYHADDPINDYVLDNLELDARAFSAPLTVHGTVLLGNYAPTDPLVPVAVKVELRQGGNTVLVGQPVLNAIGRFTLDNVTAGTYDVAIKSYAHLQKVVTGVVFSDATPDMAPVTLISGDADGNNEVDSTDLSIVLTGMDQVGQ